MPGGYDGSIRVDTRIDSKGFNLGMRGIMNSLKGLIAALGIAFGIGQILNFGKTAVDAAAQMAGALTGLQSVLDGQGRSFAKAKEFINAYTSDGLIPAANAIKSYQNLALRGYSDDQIRTVMTALKDSSAFGRQSAFTMGEAVERATEGLRNENSLLVDNAGVTKNVAQMWDDYAKSIGTTANNLTKQQKIQAEVAGILEETRFQTGDAAKAAGSYAGGVAGLSTSFYNLRVALGNALIPILTQIIPYIKALVDWFVVLFNTAARLIGLFFNVQASAGATAEAAGDMAGGVGDAAGAAGDLADNTKKAGKAAKGALAAFDDIHVLASESASGAGGAGGGVGGPLDPGITVGDPNTIIPDELAGKVAEFKAALMDLLGPAIDAFGRLRESLLGLGGTIWDGLLWIWENILVPLGEWTITDLVPAFFDLLAASADVLNQALIALQPLGLWLWENLLKPLAEWTGGAILDILKWLTDRLNELSTWIKENPESFRTIATVIGILAVALFLAASAAGIFSAILGVAGAVATAFGAATAFLATPIAAVILAIIALIAVIVFLIQNWDWVKEKAGQVWDWIKQKWSEAGVWFRTNVGDPVKNVFNIALNWVKEKAGQVWEWIKQKWGEAGTWFKTNVGDPVKNAFETALDWIGDKWETTFTGIKDFVKGMINSIIDLVNGMISAVGGGINAVIGAMNSISVTIPDWVPFYGGSSWGLSIPNVPVPQIPRLATGAVIPAGSEFLAVLGDQRSGRNLEAPEGLIRQIIREEMAGRGDEDMTANISLSLDGEVIYRNQQRIQRRRGSSLIVGGNPA